MIQTKKCALEIVGGISRPSKMPGLSIGLPANACKVGAKLRKVSGSVCEKCYTHKGMYSFPVVQQAQARRLKALTDPLWVESMIKLITGQDYFRWHDSGDIQNTKHLANIIQVCLATPKTHHWMPTKEKAIITRWKKKNGDFPPNLVVRLSAPMIGLASKDGGNTSTVHISKPFGHACPAPTQGGICGSCRACWDSSVKNVSYAQH